MNYATKPKFKYKRVKIIWQDIVTGHKDWKMLKN